MRYFLLTSVVALASSAIAAPLAPLDLGYQHLYNLEFDQAHQVFGDWAREHPDDPMGPVSDAAAYLFSEFNRLHILQSEFFLHDSTFKNTGPVSPDPAVKRVFEEALDKVRDIAGRVLARDPGNQNARLASVLRLGLRADYLGLIEKSYLASLSDIKRGRLEAQRLLAKNPTCYDAYLALGVENYMLSLKPAPVRWLLQLGGAKTNREEGLRQLRLTAEHGDYLRPYARLLLAVAALRDHDRKSARAILGDLAAQYPRNPLYREELARLKS